jgi:hypothetical protein
MKRVVLASSLLLSIAGCAATPSGDDATIATVDAPVPRVQTAAVDVLSAVGFHLERIEPDYVEGFHPRHSGSLVASGGETVGVWIEPVTREKTRMRVATARSLVGIVGQRSWTDEVIEAIRDRLKQPR